jgi:predicted ester cyclase
MSQEQMKEAFRTVIEAAYGSGKLEALDDLFAPDFVEHQAGITPPTLEGLKGSIAYLRNAFPDLKVTIEEMTVDGDRLWARLSGRGTHRGVFAGVPPTGRPITVTVMDEARFKGGRIVEHWGVADQLALMAQIGALPKPAQNKS